MLQSDKFANRSFELSKFKEFAAARDSGKRAIIFRTSKSSGATEFMRQLFKINSRSDIAIYFDMASGGLSQIADALKDCRDRRLKWRLGNFLQAAPLTGFLSKLVAISSTGLPLIVRASATALVGIGEGILVEPFPSSSAARICRMALTWPKPEIYFLLDNAQKKASEIIQLTEACASDKYYAHVRFVLAITDEHEGDIPYASFRRRLPFQDSVVDEVIFRPVDALFVSAIAAIKKLQFQKDECERLAKLAGNDMWLLLDYIHGARQVTAPSELNQMSQFVVRLLCAADQPLRQSDLRLIVFRSEQIVGTSVDFEASVAELYRLRLIDKTTAEDGDSLLALATSTAVPVRDLKKKDVANLAVTRDLYDFFSEAERARSTRHSDAALAQLLYRLSHEIDPASVPTRAQTLVRIAMSQGSVADAERYVEIAQARQGTPSLQDIFVQIALFVSMRDFVRAKASLDRIARNEFDRYRILRILDAVALNRLRRHTESNQQIDQLLQESGSDEEKVLLVSYKIGGLLHDERWCEATALAQKWSPLLKLAKNYPYFLRNAAAVYMLAPDQDLSAAEEMLDKAIRSFSINSDAYGEATTLCNYGVIKAYAFDLKAAEKYFRQSYSRLSILGTGHIQESGTNLGSALTLLGQLDRARSHIAKLLPMMSMGYPRAITEANLAMIDMRQDREADAVNRIRALILAAEEVKILDCARHVRFAGALIENVAGNAARALELLTEAEVRGGSTAELKALRKVISCGSIDRLTAFKLYRSDWMQYWSQNPLQMLPAATLTAQPELNHMA